MTLLSTQPTPAEVSDHTPGDNQACATAMAWYAISTRRHYEFIVGKFLNGVGIGSYLPVRQERRQWKYRQKLLTIPLFENYVFARFDLSRRLDVLSIKGVVRILGNDRTAIPVPDEQIEAVRIMEKCNLQYDAYPYLVQGQPVCVRRGPLSGHVGVLLDKSKKHQFFISLPLLGQSVGVYLNASDLEPT